MSVVKENKEGHLRPTYLLQLAKRQTHFGLWKSVLLSLRRIIDHQNTFLYTRFIVTSLHILRNNSSAEQITLPVTPSVLPSYQG